MIKLNTNEEGLLAFGVTSEEMQEVVEKSGVSLTECNSGSLQHILDNPDVTDRQKFAAIYAYGQSVGAARVPDIVAVAVVG